MCAIVTRRIFPRVGPTHSIYACAWMHEGKIRLAHETTYYLCSLCVCVGPSFPHPQLLAGWGRLEESKTLLNLGRDPQQSVSSFS